MPSAFAHALVGSALGSLAPAPYSRRRVAITLAVAAMAPALDVVAFELGIPYGHPLGHRGLSHAPIAALLGAPLVALVAAGRHRLLPGDASAGRRRPLLRDAAVLCLLCFVAIASHGVLDAFTDAGLGALPITATTLGVLADGGLAASLFSDVSPNPT